MFLEVLLKNVPRTIIELSLKNVPRTIIELLLKNVPHLFPWASTRDEKSSKKCKIYGKP